MVKIEDNKAVVKLKRTEACGSCQACAASSKAMLAFVQNKLGARVGDWVKIQVEPKQVIQAGFALYLLPLGGFFFGVLAGFLLSRVLNLPHLAEALSALFGFLFLILPGFLLHIYDKKFASQCEPFIKEVLPKKVIPLESKANPG